MSLNLSNVSISFFDRLARYEELSDSKDIDPEDLACARLDIIREAKKAIAEHQSPEAFVWYGWSLVNGFEGFPVNIDEGIKYLKQAVMMRSTKAMNALGDIYFGEVRGADELVDIEKAIKNYARASDLGNGYASYKLAEIYIGGGGSGEMDLRKALDYIEKSVEQESEDGICLMARWMYNGDYMKQDDEKTYEMFSKVLNGVDLTDEDSPRTWNQVDAMFFLGLLTLQGRGVDQDEEYGYNLIRQAADYGNSEAIDWLCN